MIQPALRETNWCPYIVPEGQTDLHGLEHLVGDLHGNPLLLLPAYEIKKKNTPANQLRKQGIWVGLREDSDGGGPDSYLASYTAAAEQSIEGEQLPPES
jgi:hypothetical protein